MSNEQRAHDLTMFYIELLCKVKKPDENNNINLDPYSEYVRLYPEILEKVKHDFPNA